MLTSSSIPLPYFVEADNSQHCLQDIYNEFVKLPLSINNLIINNIQEKQRPMNSIKVGNRLFVERSSPFVDRDLGYFKSNQVKRKLYFTSSHQELDEMLHITRFNIYDDVKKGISLEQTKERFFCNKEYKYVLLSTYARNVFKFLHPNLLDLNFKLAGKVKILGASYPHAMFYVKETT